MRYLFGLLLCCLLTVRLPDKILSGSYGLNCFSGGCLQPRSVGWHPCHDAQSLLMSTCPVWLFGVAQTQYTQVYGVPAANNYYISPMLHTVEASSLKPDTKCAAPSTLQTVLLPHLCSPCTR